MELQDLRRVRHPPDAHLRGVDKAILVQAYVHESAEGSQVGDYAGHFLSDLQVVDFVDMLGKGELLDLGTRVAAGLGEFLEYVIDRRKAH